MTIQIYNTMSRQKETFHPQTPGHVKMYVCGPTVYNYIHIGNARSAVAFDVIRRYLEFRGYDVEFISNFTDVDDKIIAQAKREGTTALAIADKYIEAFKEDTRAVNIRPATKHPRVQECIPEIIQFIAELIDKDYAYEAEGSVYYRTDRFKDYGKLSRQSLDELRVGASQRLDDAEMTVKENPLDFVLWRGVDEMEETSWPSPWGPGRPGWHIECSVMSKLTLGSTLDIHGGGQDLEFPHHENEIAQSEAHNDVLFSKYWMHNGFVTYGEDGEKMSKSLGNVVLLRDLVNEQDPIVVRYLLSTEHYRRPLLYSHQAYLAAAANIRRLREVWRKLTHRLIGAKDDAVESAVESLLAQIREQFIEAMDDDFNTPNGMTVIFELVKQINHYLSQDEVSRSSIQAMQQLLSELLDVFGVVFDETDQADERIEALIQEREAARQARDFARADHIRDQLKDEGILLDDTPQGTTWKWAEE